MGWEGAAPAAPDACLDASRRPAHCASASGPRLSGAARARSWKNM